DAVKGQGRQVIPRPLPDDRFQVKGEATAAQVVQQARQYHLGHVEQEIQILGETRPAAVTRRHSANEGIAAAKSIQRLRELLQTAQELLRQFERFSGHDVRT